MIIELGTLEHFTIIHVHGFPLGEGFGRIGDVILKFHRFQLGEISAILVLSITNHNYTFWTFKVN